MPPPPPCEKQVIFKQNGEGGQLSWQFGYNWNSHFWGDVCTDVDGYTGYDSHLTGQYYSGFTGSYQLVSECLDACNNDNNCWGFLISSTSSNGCYPYLSNPTSGGAQNGNDGMTVYAKCESGNF